MKNDLLNLNDDASYSDIHAAVSRNIITGLHIVVQVPIGNTPWPNGVIFLFYALTPKLIIIYIIQICIHIYQNCYAYESLIGISDIKLYTKFFA